MAAGRVGHGSAAALAVVSGLALGLLVARPINEALEIRWTERPIPAEPRPEAPSGSLAPVRPFDAVLLPAVEGPAGELLGLTARELADALRRRAGRRPDVLQDGARAPDAVRTIAVSVDSALGPETFEARAEAGGVVIRGGSVPAAAQGLTFLAARLLAGIDDAALDTLDRRVTPAFEDRFVDLGGVGIPPDSSAWATPDYSHHTHAFTHVLSPDPPYVDNAAFREVERDFRAYVRRMAAYGYDGFVFKGFLEFVDFDRVGDGAAVYPADSPFRLRHRALREAFAPLFEYARALGMQVVLNTDMVTLTPPLEAYLADRFGAIDAEDPALWQVYRAGLEELLDAMPVDGLMIRVGETGSVFNLDGWDYYSRLYVHTVPALQAMITTLADAAARRDATLYFRTWSVGIGETGGMHTRPDVYDRIFDSLDAPGLVVSTKYVAGDFYSWLPLNPTLATGDERRMVELQMRREYEGFGAFPNLLAPLHQAALSELRAENPRIRDLWVWTQEGGPLRAGPRSLYPLHGFWQLIDLNVWLGARLAWTPDADVAALTAAWVRRTFGGDARATDAITAVLLDSRPPILEGLYVAPYARRQVHALGLEPPPMLWIFEWDIVSGSSAVGSILYRLSRSEIDDAIARGHGAADAVTDMRARLDTVNSAAVSRPALFRQLRESQAYEEDLLRTLALYRETLLRHYQWLDTGDPEAFQAAAATRAQFRERREAHEDSYAGDLSVPAYSFFDAETGLRHAERSRVFAWLARLLLVLIVGTLVLVGTRRREPGPSLAAWGVGLVLATGLVLSSGLSATVPVLIALTGGSFLAALLLPRPRSRRLGWPAVEGLLGLAVVPLVPVAVRGPGYFWLRFWTSPLFRTALVALAFAAAGAGTYRLMVASRRAGDVTRRRAAGRLALAAGAPLVVVGLMTAALGLERVLTAVNEELAVLPMGLSRILGITTHLGIPTALPLYLAGAGAVLLAAGAALRGRGPSGAHP